MDCVVRDIQNTQCLLNVEHLTAGCPHVTLQFADSKGDVGLGLVKEGLVMVEVRKEKQFQKVVRDRQLRIHVCSCVSLRICEYICERMSVSIYYLLYVFCD